MTIKLRIAPGVASPLMAAVGGIDTMAFDLSLGSTAPTGFTMSGGGYSAVATGSALTYVTFAGETYPVSGVINAIDLDFGGSDLLDFSGMTLNASSLAAAIQAEDTGDSGAVERLFFAEDWVVKSNNSQDILLKTSVTEDGIAVNLEGNDRFTLKGGNDKLFSGDGDDKVFGGSGRDTLWGGEGNDVLRGGGHNDKLFGEAGDDKVFGDIGRDRVDGGAGEDLVNGGKGNDILFGGADADVFAFTGKKFGKDRVKDFEDGVDLISLNFDKITGMSQKFGNTVIEHEEGVVILVDTLLSSISEADFI